MSKKGGKPAVSDAPPPPPVVVDTTAADLLKLYAQQRAKDRADLVEFTHAKYNDWLKYFGFSMGQELQWQADHKSSLHGTRRNKTQLRATISLVNQTRAPSPPQQQNNNSGAKASENACPFAGSTPIPSACWTLPPDLAAVDAFALSLGPLPQAVTVRDVVEACTKPYKQVTWRLSAYSCAHSKVRAIYRWLCEYMKVSLPQSRAPGLMVTIQDPAAAAAPPAAAKKPTAPAKGKAGVEAPPPPPVSANPDDALLAARAADPASLAQLFARMCEEAGVAAEVVKGTVKGVLDQLGKPLNFSAWSWNIVKIADESGVERQYLVDVALSTVYLTPFETAGGAAHNRRAPTPSTDKPAAGGGKQQAAAAAAEAAAAATSASAAVNGGRTIVPAPGGSPVRYFDTVNGSKIFEPFYYFTDPREFAPLHFPEDQTKLLLSNVVSRTQWEVSPRTNHEFYALKLRLDSHKKRTVFTTKSTPIYVSVFVDELATTDLICRVYRGQMAQVDLINAEPIDAKFVWQQREESDKRVTFSIMVPDVGAYTIAIGGRSNPQKLGSSSPVPLPYFPTVLVYQVLVNFVSVNEPMFPLQHLSPTIAKLLEPMTHKVLAGPQRIAVAPSVPNVMAVGVVNRILRSPGAAPPKLPDAPPTSPSPNTPATGAKKGKPDSSAAASAAPEAPKGPEYERSDMTLLSLNAEKCVFEGTMELQLGVVELWVFLGDPATLCVGTPAPAPAASGDSPPLAADGTLPPIAGPSPLLPAAKASSLKPSGQFIPFVSCIQVVKRIPAKELSLNEGRPVIQPVPRQDKDKTVQIQLLADAGSPVPPANPIDAAGRPRVIGSYFERR